MPETPVAKIEAISERLDEAAQRLRSADLESEEATRIAGECAQLASEAAAELDRLARATPADTESGQEELL
jgi:hypothetical protein